MISWWLPVDYSVSTTVGFFFHWSIKVMRQKRVLNKKKTTSINFFNIIVVIILWSPIKVCGKKQLKQSYIYMLNILLRKKRNLIECRLVKSLQLLYSVCVNSKLLLATQGRDKR